MSIPLGDSKEFFPSLKLRSVGDQVIGHIIDLERRDETDFKTGKVKYNSKGKPRTEIVLTVLVESCSEGVVMGNRENQTRPSEGDEARIYIQGRAVGFWIDAEKAHRQQGGLASGDRFLWKYESDQPNEYDPDKPLPVRKFALRKPDPDQGAVVLLCEQRYREIHQGHSAEEPAGMPPLSNEVNF